MKNTLKLTPFVLIIKWGGISLAVILMAAVITAYLSVEFYLQRSYRNMGIGAYQEALNDASTAVNIAHIIYPASSKYLQNIFLYDIRICSRLGTLGDNFGERNSHRLVVKATIFEKANSGGLAPEERAKIDIEVARLANATYRGNGVKAMVGEVVNNTLVVNPELLAYAKEENAYQDVIGSFVTLNPQNSKEIMLNDSLLESAQKSHDIAQGLICKTDVVQCRFNQLRWKIGLCIRRAYINETPICTIEILNEVTSFPAACGNDFSIDQCYKIMNDLMPHYHHLLQAQGSRAYVK